MVGIAVKAGQLTAAASAHSRALGVITLVSWLFTAAIGAYMFGTLAARGGLRQQRAVPDGLPPAALFGHFSLALTALMVWVGYLATGWAALAWTAVGLLMPAIGLGIAAVTLWTPYPHFTAAASSDVATAGLTDEMLTRALTDEVLAGQLVDDVLANVAPDVSRATRRSRRQVAVIIPVGHGMAAVATFALAVVTAAGAR